MFTFKEMVAYLYGQFGVRYGIKKTEEKIDMCHNDDKGTGCRFAEYLENEKEAWCQFYGKYIPDDLSGDNVEKPEFCRVTRITIEEEI